MPCVMMLNASPNCGPKIIRTRSTTIATSTRMKTYSMIPCPRSPKRLIKLRAADSHLPSRRKWSKAAPLPLLSTAPCGGESGSAVPPRCQPELALSAASVHSIFRLLLSLSLLLVLGILHRTGASSPAVSRCSHRRCAPPGLHIGFVRRS